MIRAIDKSPVAHVLFGIVMALQGLICFALTIGSSPLFAPVTVIDFLCVFLHFQSAKKLREEISRNKNADTNPEDSNGHEDITSKEDHINNKISDGKTDDINTNAVDSENKSNFVSGDEVKNAAFVSPNGEMLFTDSTIVNQDFEVREPEETTEELASDYGPRKKTFRKK